MSAVSLYKDLEVATKSDYYDRRSGLSEDDYKRRLATSTTLYVGNLSPFTTESQLLAYFGTVGAVRNLHMGLNNKTFKPCGFCFVEFENREDARLAIECFNLALIDGKRIRLDWDYGFNPKR